MPDVGAAGDQGSGADVPSNLQINRLLGRGQSEYRKIHTRHVQEVRRGYVRSFLKRLLRHRSRSKRMVVVLDNARHHHAILLNPLLREYRADTMFAIAFTIAYQVRCLAVIAMEEGTMLPWLEKNTQSLSFLDV
jgi:hypothetical protein